MQEHKTYGIINNSFYILGKIKQYQPRLLLIILAGAVAESLTQYLPSFIGKFVIDIVQMQAASPDKNIIPLLKLLIITTVIDLIVSIVRLLTNNRQWFYFIYVRMHMITERVSKALSMNYQMLEQPKILDMHQKALNATGGNDNGVEGVMQSIYAFGVQVVTMIITLSAVMILNWRIILILSALSIMQYLFFRYTVKKDKRKVWDMLAPTWRKLDYMANTTQNFGYAKDIRLFGMKDWLLGRQHKSLMDKQEKMLYSRNLWIYNSAFAHVISMLTTATVYGILFFTVIDKNMSIGNFTLYLGLCTTFTSSMTEFLNAMGEFKKRSLQVDDYRSFMDLQTEEDGDFLPVPQGDSYTFEFKNVSFKYEGSETYALKNLNLTLHAGEKLAIVGHNGAGKTTFIKLLLRLYDVTEGEILLNGVDIRRFRRDEYYRLFSPVFQNVEVFAFPIAENVSMKRPADTDKELSKECLVKAGMQEKIESLANGVDTQLLKVVDDGGVDFSGGEKQKLALARALYKNAPVIILDEPTAALDALAEYNLYKNFNDIVANKSAVYISHRLSSTRFCDIIAMFKDGGMIEYGTHEELLNKGGAYAEMFEIQAQYYREKEAYENV
ncbi:MAG: ABC transporter ATP-binding protein/permease [Clostridiales bacterium]|nr:ABC transporter ATP-binding protein/permease [Clostridiales bacterium]